MVEKMTKETIEKADKKVEEAKIENETKTEVKEETKTKEKKTEAVKRDVAIANAYSLHISPRQSKYVCRVLRGKTPEAAVARLQAVIDEKRPVPMAALEVGHKRGKGLAGGKYPKNACKAIMEVVKQAAANAVVAGIESPVVYIAQANRASAPYRRAGQRAKRTHIHIEVKDKSKIIRRKKK